ncbi:MAG TPA: LPXTG cell wall anchor domain-containing protein [Micromonosporaceae bacterium]
MRRGVRLLGVTAVALAAAGGPAAAAHAAPVAASLSILSVSTPVEHRADLTIDKITIRNDGATDVSTVDLRFELVSDPGVIAPITWSTLYDLTPCHPSEPVTPVPALDCAYPVHVAAGAMADISAHLKVDPTTSSATAPAPKVKITVGDPQTGASVTTPAVNRVRYSADLAVAVDGQPTGRVGDTVDVRWVVTNNGPDSTGSFGIGLTAPSGTEWTGDAAAHCNPNPTVFHQCIAVVDLPAGRSYSETWQLKITSVDVAPGSVIVVADWHAGSPVDPYFGLPDPDQANNTAPLTVDVDTSPRPSVSATPSISPSTHVTGAPSASASPTPAAGSLPKTGSNITPYALVGVGALVAGGVLLVLVRRRRRLQFTAD